VNSFEAKMKFVIRSHSDLSFGLVPEHQNEIWSRSGAQKTFGLLPILLKM
jgi:hypothetical protein